MTIDEVIAIAESIGRREATRWPGMDAEDIAQECLTHYLAKRELMDGYDAPVVRGVLERTAKEYCGRERYRFTLNSDQYVYTPAEVRALLAHSYFDDAQWEAVPTESYGDSVSAGGVVVALWDLQDAFETLREPDRSVIRRQYRDGMTLDDASRQRLTRAVDKVTEALNRKMYQRKLSEASDDLEPERDDGSQTVTLAGYRSGHRPEGYPWFHDGPGARNTMSNAMTQHLLKGM